jgi:hypothetical protein
MTFIVDINFYFNDRKEIKIRITENTFHKLKLCASDKKELPIRYHSEIYKYCKCKDWNSNVFLNNCKDEIDNQMVNIMWRNIIVNNLLSIEQLQQASNCSPVKVKLYFGFE